jgi:hypothetical protein
MDPSDFFRRTGLILANWVRKMTAIESSFGERTNTVNDFAEKILALLVDYPGADIPVCQHNPRPNGRQECLPHNNGGEPKYFQKIVRKSFGGSRS